MIATLAVRGVDAGFWVDIASPDKVGAAAAAAAARAAAHIPPAGWRCSTAPGTSTWLPCSRGDLRSSGLRRRRTTEGVRKVWRAPGGADAGLLPAAAAGAGAAATPQQSHAQRTELPEIQPGVLPRRLPGP